MRRPTERRCTLTKWCQENHLSLNIDKTKELVVDFRRQSREHTPITIDKTPVERVNGFKFLGVHITEDLTWSTHTDAVLKKTHQHLFFLRWLRKFGMSPSILGSFYTCTVESILTGCITAWFGNRTTGNRKALQRVVRTARHIVGGELPSLQDIYTRRCIRKARRITNDSSHPSHRLFSLLPSGRRLRSIRSRTSRLRDSFFPSGYQANEQPELIHLTAHSHFTICHALHFNSTVQSGLHVHTAQIQQSICYHWIPSNAHTWHLRIQLMYNLLHRCTLLCMYICVHNVECVHTVYNVYW